VASEVVTITPPGVIPIGEGLPDSYPYSAKNPFNAASVPPDGLRVSDRVYGSNLILR